MRESFTSVVKAFFLLCLRAIAAVVVGGNSVAVRWPYGHRTAIVIFETSRQLLYSLSLLSAAAGLTFAWGPELNRSRGCTHSVFQWLPDKYE